jgi:hypothetical protein
MQHDVIDLSDDIKPIAPVTSAQILEEHPKLLDGWKKLEETEKRLSKLKANYATFVNPKASIRIEEANRNDNIIELRVENPTGLPFTFKIRSVINYIFFYCNSQATDRQST